MARLPVLQAALVVVMAAVVVVAVDAPVRASESVTVSGEYVEYENSSGWPNIGQFVDLRELFHAASLGPAGIACSADTVDVLRNEVAFTFDPTGGPVTGTGFLELTCEYHPGCGAVTRVVEASYRGEYDAAQQVMTGAVDFWTLDGESTAWGNPEEVDHCVGRWTKPGQEAAAEWVLNLGESTPTGYITSSVQGDDPRKRWGYITVSAPGIAESGDSGAVTGGNDESVAESAAESGDESGTRPDEAANTDSESGRGVTYSFLTLLVALMLGGLALSLFVGYVVRRRMGWGESDAVDDAVRAEGLEYQPSDLTTPGSDELDWLHHGEGTVDEKIEEPSVPVAPPPSSAGPVVSAEPQPIAEQHVAEAFLDMASGTIGVPPPLPPKGELGQGWEWVWVARHTEVSYSDGDDFARREVENTLQPGHWYRASPKDYYGSRDVYTEDGKEMLGDQVFDLRMAPGSGTPPSMPS